MTPTELLQARVDRATEGVVRSFYLVLHEHFPEIGENPHLLNEDCAKTLKDTISTTARIWIQENRKRRWSP